MTLAEYDAQIDNLKIIQSKATGMNRGRLMRKIGELENKRIILFTDGLMNIDLGISQNDVDELNSIADSFRKGTADLKNNLVGRTLNIIKTFT